MIKNKFLAIFFLILMMNGVFASSVNPERFSQEDTTLYFQDAPISYNPSALSACYTEELAPEAVERIWNDILVEGFKVDLLTSDQPADLSRETLEQNEVLLTNQDSKANDITVKKEVPNQLINPLEIPTILGQSCQGPFSHGLDLDSTLRVGRCAGGDDFPCYVGPEGIFRQNGMFGFWPQAGAITSDFLDMIGLQKIKETGSEIINPDLDYNTNIDLGLFSEMSYQEVAAYRAALFDENTSEVEYQKLELILDKAIKNSIKTDSFNASMESTCSSDNCYINMYSLFDKVFNQYYSADLVFTSVSPLLWKMSGRVLRPIANFTFTPLYNKDSSNLIVGKNGFLDNFLNKKSSPFKAIMDTKKYRSISKNLDSSAKAYLKQLEKSGDEIITNINRYDMKPQFDKYLDSLNSKKNIDTIKNEFFASGEFTKLNKAQQRVFVESVQEFNKNIKTGRMIHEVSQKQIDDILKTSGAKDILFDKTKNMQDFYQSLTHEQYKELSEAVTRSNTLNSKFSGYSTGKFKWDDGAKDIASIKERVKVIGPDEELLNKVRLKNQSTSVSITESKDFSKLIEEGSGGIKGYETQNVVVNFADGPKNIDMIVPYKEQIGPNKTIFNHTDLDKFKRPDLMIEYKSKASGGFEKIRGSSLDITDVDNTDVIGYFSLTEQPIPLADIPKYGIDPIEVSYAYFDSLGVKKLKDAEAVTDSVIRVLDDQGWTDGRGLNAINQRMNKQMQGVFDKRGIDLIADSGMAYLYNFGYWQLKTAGSTLFGGALDRYSMFRIPETYTSIVIKHGDSEGIYNDAYIDFFANDGSDQGDLFMQYFNSMLFWMVNFPKEALANTEWETTQGFSNWVTEFTEGSIRRSSVDKIALFTDALNNNCNNQSCNVKIGDNRTLSEDTRLKSIDSNQPINTNVNDNLNLTYSTGAGIKTSTYILENTTPKNFEKYGQTLISFSHHTDYDGSIGGFNTKDSVKLTDAIRNEETCADELKNLEVMGVPIGWTNEITNKTYRAGFIAAGFSNVAYYALSVPKHRVIMGAIFGDILPQMLIVPQIYDCVDHEEGYYTHFFVAQEEYKRIEKDPKNKVGDAISKGADNVEKSLTNLTKNTELQESIKNTTQEVKQFAEEKIKDQPIMQSRVETQGNTSASFSDSKLFFFELGANSTCRASGYNDKGVEHLVDSKKEETLVIDKEKGEVSIIDKEGNVKDIIQEKNKDWVRLIATNLGIPAKVIPHSISYIPVPDTDTPLFNIDVYGNLKIEDIQFLNCLKQNYYEQTGLEMSGNLLTEYLGSVIQVTSTNNMSPESQYDIMPKGRQNVNEIIAEGTPRQIARGTSSRITVLGDRTTRLFPIEGKEVTIGKNIAIQFERGQLIYNGEKNSYIMWVEQTYIMHQSEIKGMDVKPTKETNPVTGCEDDAFEMSIKPDLSNPESIAKSEEMNKALEKVGPFQMFDTPSKTFIFYTTEPPECQNRMKIIDKKTGQVIDQAIDSILQTPDGFIVKTEDGMEHNFGFSAEDGVPKLKYNDSTETLLTAQGKNGSFWYDPQTGNWYTENGHLIPLNPDFRDGVTFKVGEDGKTTGTTVNNILGSNTGGAPGDKGALNIPLTPENFLQFALYILIIVGSFLYLNNRKENFKK